jgi:hypothetical protein
MTVNPKGFGYKELLYPIILTLVASLEHAYDIYKS